jgi:hypothetical protein
MPQHWFWLAIVIIVVCWYSSVTVYVAIRGALDIKHMLRNLADSKRRRESERPVTSETTAKEAAGH